jgi:hypothetical protein
MKSNVGHRLVGYDRVTDRVADEHDIPANLMPWARGLAHVPEDDPETAMCYPLEADDARRVAGAVGAAADTSKNDYFLEGFAL